jgi:YHS domain-containing protein
LRLAITIAESVVLLMANVQGNRSLLAISTDDTNRSSTVIRSNLHVLALIAIAATANASEGWYETYQEAHDVAQQKGLPMLLHFHASYCGPCRQMSAQVFSQPDVQSQLRQGIAAVEVDVQFNSGLAQQYGATTVPRDVVVFPDGTHETLNVGFKSTYAYMDLLRNVASRGARFAKSEPTPEIRAADPEPPQVAQKEIIGLEGFCPVQLIRDRKWVSGQPELAESYRGITYYFSTEAERKEFQQSPAKFTPQNLGCDPVVLYADQQAISGQIKYGAFFDSKLFLFETTENRTEFKANPLKYSLIRHAIKVDELSQRQLN